MYEHWSDTVTVTWDFTVGPLSFIANLVLIFIILKYTPESTKTYAVLPRGNQLFFLFRGLCIYLFNDDFQLRARVCQSWYTQHMQFYILNHFLLIFSYVFRMLIITNPFRKIDNRKVVYSILLVYCPLHFCYFNWVTYMSFQPQELISRELAKIQPEIVASNATYSGIIYLTDPSQIVFNILSVSSAGVTIVITLFCRWRTIHFTRKYQQSEVVRKLHKSLEQVFSCQTIGPLMSSMASILYMLVLAQAGASNGTIILLENLIGRPIVFMYIVNPIVTIFFLTPYRNAVIGWFQKHPVSVVQPVSTIGDT